MTIEVLPLDRPSSLPDAAESAVLRERAVGMASHHAAPLGPLDRFRVHAASWTPKQRKEIAVVGRYFPFASAEVFAASYIGLELAVACTTSQLESEGRHIYGADPASSWMNDGPFGALWEHEVTKANFAWFWAGVERGETSNGVGIKQLTSASLIAAANKRGGAWVPEHNCAEGDEFFLELIHQTGSLWSAFYHYNGSGPAAEAYANNAVATVAIWRSRLG